MPWLKGWKKGTDKPKDGSKPIKLSEKERDLLDRLQSAAKDFESRLKTLAEKKNKAPDRRMREQLEQEMQELKMALHRMEAALMSGAEIRQAQAEWGERLEEEIGEETGHPIVRHEILRSEAEARSWIRGNRKRKAKAEIGNKRLEGSEQAVKTIVLEKAEEKKRATIKKRTENVSKRHLELEPEHIIPSIRALSREVAWACQEPEPNAKEIMETLRCVKDLHGQLKKRDKAKGIRRDRLALTDGFRHMHLH